MTQLNHATIEFTPGLRADAYKHATTARVGRVLIDFIAQHTNYKQPDSTQITMTASALLELGDTLNAARDAK